MEIVTPTDLIQKLQLSLRAQAGLPAYDPTLPALPSLSHLIDAVDPSPADLRCRHCRGKLLRGLHSAVCFYCGGYQLKEEKVDPIGFRSTVGCRWLLKSLKLDGSEIVEPSIDGRVLNKNQSFPSEKIQLSDLLNFQISWHGEPEIIEHSSINLGGVDLDNLFTYAKSLASDIEEEKAVTNKQIDHLKLNAFSGQENPTSVSSTVAKYNDGFSGWKADFQFAESA